MQEPQQYKKTRRRKTGRTESPILKALSSNAYRMEKAANRHFATIRLSVRGFNFKTLKRIADFYGVTMSKAARVLLKMSDLMERGSTGEAAKLINAFEAKIKNGSRGRKRRTISKADLWAKGQKSRQQSTDLCLRLTAYNLANIGTKQAELEAQGLKGHGATFSRAFNSLLLISHIPFEAMIDDYEAGINGRYWELHIFQLQKPTRQKRNRTMTEIKRRIKEEGTRTGL